MPLPHRLNSPGGFPDWVGEGRFVPGHRHAVDDAADGPAASAHDALHFVFQEQRLLFPDDPAAACFGAPPPELPELRRSMLGWLDGRSCLAIDIAADTPAPPGFSWQGLRALFPQLEAGMIALAGRAFQVLEWERTHQYCGRCATPMLPRTDERARACPACGFTAYPRISPVVMGLVVRGRELLLARSPHFAPGMYSAVAGFVETGETLEHALAREILEETSIRARNYQYFDSQPWPFPHSLMVAFTAEYLSGEPVPQPDEIEDVRWFDIAELPQLPPTLSIAGRLIRAVVEHLRHA
ncbi:MAG: NAD(+) diphosphatase [Pseudomonadota bacterium]|nr:NAD(+) diphosphatase [Pseudomonadota bacterium]